MNFKQRILDGLQNLDVNKDGKVDPADVRYLINRELGETVSSEKAFLFVVVVGLFCLVLGAVAF